jgi:hypothetical protein
MLKTGVFVNILTVSATSLLAVPPVMQKGVDLDKTFFVDLQSAGINIDPLRKDIALPLEAARWELRCVDPYERKTVVAAQEKLHSLANALAVLIQKNLEKQQRNEQDEEYCLLAGNILMVVDRFRNEKLTRNEGSAHSSRFIKK